MPSPSAYSEDGYGPYETLHDPKGSMDSTNGLQKTQGKVVGWVKLGVLIQLTIDDKTC